MTVQQRIRPDFATIISRYDQAKPVELALAFTSIEREAIRLADFDDHGSVVPLGRMARFLRVLIAPRVNPELANPRLEALRRLSIALKARRPGASGPETEAALAAGFSPEQIGVLKNHLRVRLFRV